MKWQGEGAAGEDGSEKPETKKREFGQEWKGVWDAWNDLELVEKALAESAGMVTTVEPCTLAQSDHLWGLAVTKPMILSTKFNEHDFV